MNKIIFLLVSFVVSLIVFVYLKYNLLSEWHILAFVLLLTSFILLIIYALKYVIKELKSN